MNQKEIILTLLHHLNFVYMDLSRSVLSGTNHSIFTLQFRLVGTATSYSNIRYQLVLTNGSSNLVYQEFECFNDLYNFVNEHNLHFYHNPQLYRNLLKSLCNVKK